MGKIFKAATSVFLDVLGTALLLAPGTQGLGLAILTIGARSTLGLFAKRPNGWRGDSLQISLSPTDPRKVVLHRTATGGALVTWQTWGDTNKNLILLVRLADHKCKSLVAIWWNGKRCVPGVDGAIAEARVGGDDYLWVTFKDGDWNQEADAELISVSSLGGVGVRRWTSNDRGRGVAHVKVKALASDKAHPQGLSGLFQIVYELEGGYLYDPRLDGSVGGTGAQRFNDQSTWTYNANQNAALALENLWRGFRVEDTSAPVGSRAMDVFYGLSLTDADLPFDENVAAMNVCDEAVGLKAGGTEPRYAAAGVLSADQPVEAAQTDLLTAMAGEAMTGVSRWVILPGAARTPERTFTNAHFRIDATSGYQDFTPLGQTVNCVTGKFADPAQRYQAIDLPPRMSTDDVIADGGLKVLPMDMALVTSASQGQRLMEIERREARLSKTVTGTLPPDDIDLEGGDWVTLDDARHGFVADFKITSAGLATTADDMLKIPVALAQVSAASFTWNPATDELDRTSPAPLPSTPPADPDPPVIAGITAPAAGEGVRLLVSLTGAPAVAGLAWRLGWQVDGEAGWSEATFTGLDGPAATLTSGFVPKVAVLNVRGAFIWSDEPIWSATVTVDTTTTGPLSFISEAGDRFVTEDGTSGFSEEA